jgi:alanine racemase
MMTNQVEEKLTVNDQEELDNEVKNSGKKRLNLDLTPDAYKLLQKLSKESGKNMTEVLRTGLALYGIAQEESQKGNTLSITKDDKVVARIISPV